MSTVFNGAFETSFGGFPTVRGYARLSDLAKCSFADDAYQRELKKEHVEDIKTFFNDGEYLFFPEIILSVQLDVDYSKDDAPKGDPFQLIRDGKRFRSNTNGLIVTPRKPRSSSDLTRYEVTIPDDSKILKRIDGNHRLTALEALNDVEFERYMAPFCLVFFGSEKKAKRNEKALFHNINSKALPLTSEESLKGIVDDVEDFPDEVLRDRFGPEYLHCRKLRKRLDFGYLQSLCCVFGRQEQGDGQVRSTLIKSMQDIKSLLPKEQETDEDELFAAIKRVDVAYNDPRLKNSVAQGLFAAFLYFDLADDKTAGSFEQFRNWVLRTHQYELKAINAEDLIKIFKKIAESRQRQIFVSMQFSDETKPNFDAIESAVADVNKTHDLDIKINPIRIDRFETGYSYEINKEVLELIESSGLLIADLTLGNKNVYHEIGYLMGLNQGQGLPHENFLLLHNGNMGDVSKDIGFNIAGIKQLRLKDTNSIREKVKEQIEIFFGLTV